ncbi:hypothetical protein DRO66_11640 [Candidatus Bathyarchaeota archaeon]|nr:MAG: hypothetical protein DRO66_11640 [Candidatus Bathyarchaeota archaeon]
MWFGVDNVWTGSGVPEHGVNPTYSGLDTSGGIVPVVCTRSCITGSVNFGQRTFAHTPPEGFHPVAYKYLPEPTIMEGDIGVDVALWTGNTSTQHITGLKFKPDFVWIKDRLNLNNHCVFDVDRGATKWMRMDDASVAENTDVDSLTSFNADGFSLGDDIKVNVAARTYAGLCLRKGKKFGFDIQLYTGDGETSQLIDHKLGGTPELMVVWNRTQGRGTMMYHHHMANKTDPETDYITLDGPNNYVDLLAAWNDTKPTASQLTVGSHANCNENGESFVAWLWRSIPGFSKVWSFEGNGSAASGPFVYCGFKPRYILFRNADANNSWRWYDTRRNLYNYNSMNYIIPNGENVETAEAAMNIHTQGFRMTSGNDALNRNGYTHVGLALAEHPAKYANAR